MAPKANIDGPNIGAEDDNSESGGDEMSEGGAEDQEISEAVDMSMQCFGSLSSPAAVLDAFDAVESNPTSIPPPAFLLYSGRAAERGAL